MTEQARKTTYRTPTGRLITDADIEQIAEEVATTDGDLHLVEARLRQRGSQPSRNADIKSPRSP